MEEQLRSVLQAKADEMQLEVGLPPSKVRGIRIRRAVTIGGALFAVAAIAASAITLTGASTDEQIPPAPDLPPETNDFDIYTMATDGSNVIRVTENPADESQPTWSPDGERLAFVRYEEDGSAHLFVTDPASGEVQMTFGSGLDETPAWSPDGRYIAFTRKTAPAAPARIFILDVESREARPERLIEHVATSLEEWPSWSPDSRHIAFVGSDATIFRFDFADGSVTPLVKSQGGFGKTAWGPDGLIATTVFNELEDVYVLNEDGTGLRRVTDLPQLADGFPAWSPDGRTIAFMAVEDGGADEIRVVPALEGSRGPGRALTNNEVPDGFPAWSPDGDRIAFASNR